MSKYQFVGVDFAWTDPRSVSAYLRGYGDGRGEKYDRFYERMRQSHPEMSLEIINQTYHLERQRIACIQYQAQKVVRKYLLPLIQNAPVLLLGILIGLRITST